MRKSSANQLEFALDYSSAQSHKSAQLQGGRLFGTQPAASPASGGVVRLPEISGSSETVATTVAKSAGRQNAAKATDAEYNDFLRERASLLDKHFAGTISRKEAIRLEFVNWSLDRIEDARYGPALDMFDAAIGNYEQFSSEIAALTAQIAKHSAGKRNERRKR